MPWRSQHPCGIPGCPHLARRGPRCSQHQPTERPTAAVRGYDAAWAKLRAAHLARQPNCQRIEANGSACKFCGGTRPTKPHVDHIRAHHGDDRLRLDPRNLRTLCHRAHSSKTSREDGGLGHMTR